MILNNISCVLPDIGTPRDFSTVRNNGHGQAGKQLRSARCNSDNYLLDAVKEALRDDNVMAGLAERTAAVVTETIAIRPDAMDKSLRDKDEQTKQLEEDIGRVDAQLENMEQCS